MHDDRRAVNARRLFHPEEILQARLDPRWFARFVMHRHAAPTGKRQPLRSFSLQARWAKHRQQSSRLQLRKARAVLTQLAKLCIDIRRKTRKGRPRLQLFQLTYLMK